MYRNGIERGRLPDGASAGQGDRRLRVRRGGRAAAACAWAAACGAAILYGSLLPDPLLALRHWSSIEPGMLRVGLAGAGLEDVVTNLIVYMPLGCLVWFALHRLGVGLAAAMAASLLVGALVSTTAEVLQTAVPRRVASGADILLNVSGMGIGALGGWGVLAAWRGSWGPRLRHRWTRAPLGTLSCVLTIVILAGAVLPFHPVTTTDELHDSFRRANWDLFSPHVGESGLAAGAISLKVLAAAWFAALGYLGLLARRAGGADLPEALTGSLTFAIPLAASVEVLQLFSRVHVFDPLDIVLRSAGVLLGCWMASSPGRAIRLDAATIRMRDVLPSRWLVAGACCCAAGLLIEPLRRMEEGWSFAWLPAAVRLPFEGMWRGAMQDAGHAVFDRALRYGFVVLACGVILRRRGVRGAWGCAAVVALGVAWCAAVLQGGARGVVDLTGPTIALAVSVVLRYAYPRVRRMIAATGDTSDAARTHGGAY
jgi:hypothetical protein